MPAPNALPCLDIFGEVIDHLGDAGTCWRLTRELRQILPRTHLRLWMDQPGILRQLLPRGTSPCHPSGTIRLGSWREAQRCRPARARILAFGCEPPPMYREAQAPPGLTVHLEYFTAETWAEEMHGMESLLPDGQGKKFFFFPGLTASSGGLLSLSRPRIPEGDRPRLREALLRFLGLPLHLASAQWIPSYLYTVPGALHEALSRWSEEQPLFIPAFSPAVRQAFPPSSPANDSRPGLFSWPAPPVSQPLFDWILALSDLALIRGEDSLSGALLSGQPFLWQPYPQAQDHHRHKGEALACAIRKAIPPDHYTLWWEAERHLLPGNPGHFSSLLSFFSQKQRLLPHLDGWSTHLRDCNLARNLAQFLFHHLSI